MVISEILEVVYIGEMQEIGDVLICKSGEGLKSEGGVGLNQFLDKFSNFVMVLQTLLGH